GLKLGELRGTRIESRRAASQALAAHHDGLEDRLLLAQARLQGRRARTAGGEFPAQLLGGAVRGERERLGVGRSGRQLEANLDVRMRAGLLFRLRLLLA